ncbi:MAG TPA: ROK family protein [Solirubrobacterales bacterium]|nr:ROK family protein [Solirubrobacterales bacterium]
MRRSERIHQVIAAVSKEGPLTFPDLVDRLPDIQDKDHLRKEIVADAVAAEILIADTRKHWDLPKALTARKGNATHYVGVGREVGCVLGISVGRTYFALGVADSNGRLFSKHDREVSKEEGANAADAQAKYVQGQIVVYTRNEDVVGESLLCEIAGAAKEWMQEVEVEPHEVRGVTIGLPVPVSTTQSKLLTKSLETPLSSVPHIASSFEEELGEDFTSLQKVIVSNDADIAARAEVRYGEAYGMKDVVVVHAAYGIGAGVLAEGKVLRTTAGGGIGEVGHCVPTIGRDRGQRFGLLPLSVEHPVYRCACGQLGHLEALAGGSAIIKRLKHSPEVYPKPPEALAKLLEDEKANDADVLEAILRAAFGSPAWKPGRAAVLDAAHLIGGGVHTLTHVFRPEAVYLGGKLSEAGNAFLKEVQGGFTKCGPLTGYEPKIALGTAGSQFGRRHVMVRGAAMTAVRGTESLVDVERIEEKLAAVPEDDWQ